MTPDLGEHPASEPLQALNALAREARDSVVDPSPAERSGGWAQVARRMRRLDRRRRLVGVSSAVALVAAAAVLVMTWGPAPDLGPTPARELAYQIQGGSVVDGGYLSESGPDGIRLRFGEGTEVAFAARTRARLRSVSSTGARIAIEHGQARFRVTPRREADWTVEVGPFLVTVKGTVFKVAWDAVTERFDITLERGLVSVAGPVTRGPVLLKEGQTLTVDLPRKESVITESGPDRSDSVAASEGPAAPGIDSDGTSAARESSAGRDSTVPRALGRTPTRLKPNTHGDWAQAVAAGDWDRILADADRAGARQILTQASSEELLALADAARYRRRADLAREALLANRRRFPGSPSALDAAYLLGRLAESGRGGLDQALAWYDTYLAGAPAGPYASEALGRKMMAFNQLHKDPEARALARDYLGRFPSGSYAGAARALLPSP